MTDISDDIKNSVIDLKALIYNMLVGKRRYLLIIATCNSLNYLFENKFVK